MSDVWVLTKTVVHDRDEDDVKIMGVYERREDLEARVERIGSRNPQYPLRKLGGGAWRIGPDEDEGFFGNRPVYLRALVAPYHGAA